MKTPRQSTDVGHRRATDVEIGDKSELMEISFVYNGRKYTNDLDTELKINGSDLDTEFIEQPSKYGWFAAVYALAQENADRAEARVTAAEAELDGKFRSAGVIRETTEDGEEVEIKLTEDGLKKAIARDRDIRQLKEDAITAKRNASIIKSARDAFEHRKDMLIQLGASARQERGNPEMTALKEKARKVIKDGRS